MYPAKTFCAASQYICGMDGAVLCKNVTNGGKCINDNNQHYSWFIIRPKVLKVISHYVNEIEVAWKGLFEVKAIQNQIIIIFYCGIGKIEWKLKQSTWMMVMALCNHC